MPKTEELKLSTLIDVQTITYDVMLQQCFNANVLVQATWPFQMVCYEKCRKFRLSQTKVRPAITKTALNFETSIA